ncbi:DUF2235 domain-containing protein [Saccharothrix sp. Mg75]|uniref:DUF2235 domain-containing protein n=1 Tax=Saccharothrix sp. Mg75 TaxID=3445357 RepID=UPI003EEF1008
MTTRRPEDTGRNLVLCLDGTCNEPEAGTTNVARAYDIAVKDQGQVVYYSPGVGTMGARGAVTGLGKAATRFAGVVVGYGVRENIEEAYRFLMRFYRRGDRIFLFGFSRGAYTARALAGLLRTVGLLRPGADNLVPYALKLYTRSGRAGRGRDEAAFWSSCSDFQDKFGNPDFPGRFAAQIRYLGVWDTVKTVGWLNWRARYEQARWPFTRKLPNVTCGRHALAIDERRRHYEEYRFHRAETGHGGRLREMWFAGAHSDVGGTFPDDHRLSDIALHWVLRGAVTAGLRVDPAAYLRHVTVPIDDGPPSTHALGAIHPNGIAWALVGPGRHHRVIAPGDEVHPSVHERITSTRGTAHPYRPALPATAAPGRA